MPPEIKALDGETLVIMGGAVKALTDNTFELCMYKFTSATRKDLTSEYFSDETDFVESDYPLTGKLLYHHGLSSDVEIHPIGEIISVERRPGDGIYGKGVIDFSTRYKRYVKTLRQPEQWKAEQEQLADDYQKMLEDLNRKGMLAGSGGALPQSFRRSADGHIERWAQIEYTLTPAPAEPEYTWTTKSTPVKSLPALIPLRELMAREATDAVVEIKSTEQNDTTQKGNQEMNVEELKRLIAAFVEQLQAYLGEGAPAPAEEEIKAAADEAAEEVKEEEEKVEEGKSVSLERIEAIAEKHAKSIVEKALVAQASKQARARKAADEMKAKTSKGVSAVGGYSNPGRERTDGNGSDIKVGDNLKYAHLSASDMALGLMALKSNPQLQRLNLPVTAYVSEEYVKHMTAKAEAFMDKTGFKKVEEHQFIKSTMPKIKANELDASNIATQGAEWAGDFWSQTIIERARSNRIYKEVLARGVMEQVIPEGMETAFFPIEGNDPVAYVRNQANSVDATRRPETTVNINPFTTGNVSVTPNELALATSYTTILKEDSIIPIANQMNYQVGEKMDETIEQALINGDTTTTASTNINLIDGTPASGLFKPYYLLTDGWLKHALVTYTAQSRNGGAMDENDFRLTVKLLDRAIRSRKEKLLFLMDSDTYNTALDIVAIKTDEVRAKNSTLTTGNLEEIYGYKTLESGFMELANSAGKVPTAAGTLGRLLLIYPPYWGIAWKRRLTIEEAYDPLSGTFVYVASLRMGMVARGANGAAVTYNLTIA
jgi:hypothetical protein